jgi:hypothetical protein
MRIVLWIFGISLLLVAPIRAQPVPQFRQFSIAREVNVPVVSPDLSTSQAYNYRTRLRAAAAAPVNFAGAYRLATWGCDGDQCQTGAVVDRLSGSVVFLPFNICCSIRADEPGFRPVDFH